MQHEKEIEIRWRDLDVYGHVNHVVFLTYLEEARDEWLGRALDDPEQLWNFVVARVEIDFRRELSLADDVVVARVRARRASARRACERARDRHPSGETTAEARRRAGRPRRRDAAARGR